MLVFMVTAGEREPCRRVCVRVCVFVLMALTVGSLVCECVLRFRARGEN